MTRATLIAALALGACACNETEDTEDTGAEGTTHGEALPLYDDFQASLIDTAKWLDQELIREVRDDEAALEVRYDYPPDDDSWLRSDLRTHVGTRHDSIQADVTLLSHEVVGVQTRLTVELCYQPQVYWDLGSNQDFFCARSQIRDSGDGLRIVWSYFGCADPLCDTDHPMPGWEGDAPPSTAAEDQEYTLFVTYDPGSDSWEIGADELSATVDLSGVEAFDASDFKFARVTSRVIQVDASGDEGFVAARADDVYLDGTLFDDFDGAGRIDPAKWYRKDFVREVVSGELVVKLAESDRSRSNDLRIKNPEDVSAMYAELTVDEVVLGGTPRARVGGEWYSDGSSGDGTGGANGDIWAEIGTDGSKVFALVVRCTDEHCHVGDVLTTDPDTSEPGVVPIGTVAVGETHGLFIQWDGQSFAFQLDDGEPFTFDPVAAGAPVVAEASRPMRVVGTRARLSSGESSYLAARFDGVRVGEALTLE